MRQSPRLSILLLACSLSLLHLGVGAAETLGAAAWTGSGAIHHIVDVDAPQEGGARAQRLVAEAFDSWTRTNPAWSWRLAEPGEQPTLVVVFLPQARVPCGTESRALGCYHGANGTVLVSTHFDGYPRLGRDILLVLRHEAGHAYGLEHADTGVMRATADVWDLPMVADPSWQLHHPDESRPSAGA